MTISSYKKKNDDKIKYLRRNNNKTFRNKLKDSKVLINYKLRMHSINFQACSSFQIL